MASIAPISGNTAITSASPNPTAQANAALSANANIPAGQAGSPWTAAPVTQAPGTGTGVPNPSTPTTSTTVQSNANVIQNKVPAITATTNNLANSSGISTNLNGQTTYANGTAYNPQQPVSQTNLPSGESYVNGQLTYTGTNGTGTNNNISPTGTLIQGGYIGDTYYAPGTLAANIPTDANGQPQQLSSQGTTDSQILTSLQNAKASADSLTASLIDSITSQYQSLITNQQQANSSEQASVGHSLIKEGTSQLDPTGAAQITQAQVSYGLSQIADLQSKEQSAIISAQQAGQDEDFKLMDDMNTEAQDMRTQQQDAAQKILDAVTAQNQKLADAKLQQNNDAFIASQIQSGISDPATILANAQSAGDTTITTDQIKSTLADLSPDKAQIQSLAAQAAAAGADPATVAKIAASADFDDALALATPALGEKNANDLKQQAFQDKIAQDNVSIAQENADTNRDKLLQDNSEAGLAANNAVVTTPIIGANGKPLTYVNGTGLSDAAKAAALSAGQVVLDGDSATAMTQITNTLGQVNNLLATFKSNGVDLSAQGNNSIPGQAGATKGFFKIYVAGNATPAVQVFATALQGTTKTDGIISDLQKLPGTGNLVSVLENNIPSTTDSASVMQGKIVAITGALNSAANTFLSSGSTPQDGQTGTINGQSVTFENGMWVTQ